MHSLFWVDIRQKLVIIWFHEFNQVEILVILFLLQILSIAIAKGQLNQSVQSRLASCQIIGKVATRFDSFMWVFSFVLPWNNLLKPHGYFHLLVCCFRLLDLGESIIILVKCGEWEFIFVESMPLCEHQGQHEMYTTLFITSCMSHVHLVVYINSAKCLYFRYHNTPFRKRLGQEGGFYLKNSFKCKRMLWINQTGLSSIVMWLNASDTFCKVSRTFCTMYHNGSIILTGITY